MDKTLKSKMPDTSMAGHLGRPNKLHKEGSHIRFFWMPHQADRISHPQTFWKNVKYWLSVEHPLLFRRLGFRSFGSEVLGERLLCADRKGCP